MLRSVAWQDKTGKTLETQTSRVLKQQNWVLSFEKPAFSTTRKLQNEQGILLFVHQKLAWESSFRHPFGLPVWNFGCLRVNRRHLWQPGIHSAAALFSICLIFNLSVYRYGLLGNKYYPLIVVPVSRQLSKNTQIQKHFVKHHHLHGLKI